MNNAFLQSLACNLALIFVLFAFCGFVLLLAKVTGLIFFKEEE